MIYVQLKNDDIEMIHYMPFDSVHGLNKTQAELEKEGVLVDSLPVPEDNGKLPTLKYEPTSKSFYYEYVDRVLSPEEEIQLLKEENTNRRLEMAKSNTELFEMMVAMSGGTT